MQTQIYSTLEELPRWGPPHKMKDLDFIAESCRSCIHVATMVELEAIQRGRRYSRDEAAAILEIKLEFLERLQIIKQIQRHRKNGHLSLVPSSNEI